MAFACSWAIFAAGRVPEESNQTIPPNGSKPLMFQKKTAVEFYF